MAAPPLAGRCVLLTRPRPESEALAARIASAGGASIIFPTLEIVAAPVPGPALAALRTLGGHRLAVFVSANAVRHGIPLIRSMGGWPPGLAAAAVGAATADALRAEGVRELWVPEAGGDSDALLALPQLQNVAGWRVLVFRGVGGRELLAKTLQVRGAQVTYIECYRRVVPAVDAAPVRSALLAERLDAVVAASAEGLRNLLDLIGTDCQGALRSVALVVTHANVAQAARALGFQRVEVAHNAHDAMVEHLAGLPVRHA
jgi:uroporphyrinogen-III synthase